MKTIDAISAMLLVIRGLNGGIRGIFNVDVPASSLGGYSSPAARIIYVVFGTTTIHQALSVKAAQIGWEPATT